MRASRALVRVAIEALVESTGYFELTDFVSG
jgi:hypothetical protein